MSKIEDLIRQYCPNGCEWKRLGDLIRLNLVNVVTPSFKIKRNDYLNEGMVSIISQEAEYISGYWNVNDNRIVDDKYVCFGDHSEHLKYIDFPFVQGADGLKIMKCVSNTLNTKYLYYSLCNEYVRQNDYARHFSKLRETSIPVPPLPIQKEIVRILDKFTELEKELEKELEMRKKQYEWYRDELLTFGDEVERHDITEVFDLRNGYTPSKSVKEYWENGTVDWFRMEDIREHGNVLSEATQKVSESAVKGGKKIKANSIALATTATIGEHALIIVDCLGNQQFTFFTKSELFFDKVNMNFMNYYFFKIDEWCKTHTRQGNFASVDMDALKQLQIPVPPLQEQQRIVEILDTFDTLTTDLTKGLPAEIKMRHMQYEYYRDYLFGLLK